jgi:transcriptional regulator NrdR family protein
VKCPVCDNEYLEVKDIIPELDAITFERMMYCSGCHSVNYLLMKKDNK